MTRFESRDRVLEPDDICKFVFPEAPSLPPFIQFVAGLQI